MFIFQMLSELPPQGEPCVANVTAVKKLNSAMSRLQVMVESSYGSGNVVAVWYRAGVALLPVGLKVIDQGLCHLEGLVAEGTFVRPGPHVTIANVLHKP